MGGAAGFEVDRADAALGTPPHALVMATATGFSDVYQHVVEEVLLSDSKQGGTVNPLVKGDIVYFEGPKGGAVFSVGVDRLVWVPSPTTATTTTFRASPATCCGDSLLRTLFERVADKLAT